MDQSLNKFNVKYKIISVNEEEQSIIVRYWTDFLSEEDLRISDDNFPDGSPIRCKTDYNFNIWDTIKTEQDLHNMLINYVPFDWFKLQYKVKNPEIDNSINGSLSIVKGLLNKTHEKLIDRTKLEDSELTDGDIEKMLNEIINDQKNTKI